jgi:hypothetical protein
MAPRPPVEIFELPQADRRVAGDFVWIGGGPDD